MTNLIFILVVTAASPNHNITAIADKTFPTEQACAKEEHRLQAAWARLKFKRGGLACVKTIVSEAPVTFD